MLHAIKMSSPNSYLLLVIHSEHILTGSLKAVLMDCLQGAAISILTFQGYLNHQNS